MAPLFVGVFESLPERHVQIAGPSPSNEATISFKGDFLDNMIHRNGLITLPGFTNRAPLSYDLTPPGKT